MPHLTQSMKDELRQHCRDKRRKEAMSEKMVAGIVVNIAGEQHVLSFDEAKALRDELVALLGAGNMFVPFMPEPTETWPEWKPVITSGTTATPLEDGIRMEAVAAS